VSFESGSFESGRFDSGSFESGRGTRGAWMPWPPLLKAANRVVAALLRRGGGRLSGTHVLVLTTVGARSGEQRTSPVSWFPTPDGGWWVVASANGAARNPAWYFNLAAHPDQAAVEVAGERVDVVARQLAGAERAAAWQAITARAPRFTGYAKATDREIPVIELTRRPQRSH
jgi:deazaflavin-dependent oxidoreductase (nitroreductase family)